MMDGGFMPHGECFLWQPSVLALHVISDALIALAYFSIPVVLLLLVRKRDDLPFRAAFLMFSLFIVSCGLTHVMAIVVIWHPLYWLEGWLKALTAAASIATGILLLPMLPRALRLRSPAELERLNERLQHSVDESARLLRRYEREHYIATTLQSASLGIIPERIGPFGFSAVYHPGVGDMEIGGDWYDAFALPDGRVVVSIGDVLGKGLHASIVMAKMRQAIRVAAQVQVAPRAILDAADRALRLEYADQIVTAFVGIMDPTECYLTYATAGHPPPLLREPDGTIREVVSFGLPLGLRNREPGADVTMHLDPGSLLVLYTDGLTESTHDYREGDRRLRAALERPALARARDPAATIYDGVLFDGIRDDVAILVVRVGQPDDVAERWSFPVVELERARAVRETISRRLAERGARADALFTADIVLSELLGNVLRHAPGTVDVRLDWNGSAPILHVLDEGPGFVFVPRLPTNMFSESGRGLFIITQIAPELTIVHRPGGGGPARAVLPLVPDALAAGAR
jgi:serine phosphatase RsbU (regulator of sigma subunit)/anti-sigma regulatory factor (Ser/Thr protein kinase)